MGIKTAQRPMAAHAAVKAFPGAYAVVPQGDCMEPLYKDGAPLIISSTAPCEQGDVVIIHFKPEFVKPGGFEAWVKRLKWPLYGMEFPWVPQSTESLAIPVTVEQLNPPKSFNIDPRTILAVHKVVGVGAKAQDGSVKAPRAILEAA